MFISGRDLLIDDDDDNNNVLNACTLMPICRKCEVFNQSAMPVLTYASPNKNSVNKLKVTQKSINNSKVTDPTGDRNISAWHYLEKPYPKRTDTQKD